MTTFILIVLLAKIPCFYDYSEREIVIFFFSCFVFYISLLFFHFALRFVIKIINFVEIKTFCFFYFFLSAFWSSFFWRLIELYNVISIKSYMQTTQVMISIRLSFKNCFAFSIRFAHVETKMTSSAKKMIMMFIFD
jgi:hypothetical protein